MVFYEKMKSRQVNPHSKDLLKIMEDNNNSILIGLTKITLDFDVLQIQYSGRCDHTMDNVNWNLSDINISFISVLKKLFTVLHEQGHPDYYYVIQLQI